MKKLASALVAALAMTVCALGADVTFAWDSDPTSPSDGSVLRFYADPERTVLTKEHEVPDGTVETATVVLEKGVHYTVVFAWAETLNPDGTKVRSYSEPSNMLEVKVAGKSANVKVVDVNK